MLVISAIVPIFLILSLGKALTYAPLIDRQAWNAVERLVLYVLFPALIIKVLASAAFEASMLGLISVLIIAQILMGLMGVSTWRLKNVAGPSTASIVQSNVRFNTFVGLSIASAFFGDAGLALFAVAAAGMIPVANLISISAFEAFADQTATKHQRLISIIRNPLIIACLIGGGLSVSGTALPRVATQSLDLLSQAAIALGLLCAGAAIDFSSLQIGKTRLVFWSLCRLIGFPLIVAGLAGLFGLSGIERAVAIIAAATPTSTSGAILASQLKGDTALATNLIAAQTILCSVTIPALLLVFDVY